MARKPDPTARDRILDNASRLFAEHGVRAVGLQQIIDACGCGKNLLYREFGSKDELVLAHIERFGEEWRAARRQAAEAAPGDPAEQLVHIVGIVAEEARTPGFRGCPLSTTLAEFPEPEHPVHQRILAHYAERRDSLVGLARRTPAPDPGALADRLVLIIEGLNASAAATPDGAYQAAAAAFARETVAAAIRSA